MHDANSTINDFLAAAAAKQPTPGGGSAAALAGALAASMGEMVVNYSVGKKSLAEFGEELAAALGEFSRARQLLLGLMVEDQSAYEALTAARKLPESAPARQSDFDVALLASVRVPEAIGLAALAILDLAERIVEKVNPLLLSDLAVCADLAMATVRCATYNIKANLSDVTDPEDRRRIEQIIARLQSRSLEIIKRLSPRIWQRQARGS